MPSTNLPGAELIEQGLRDLRDGAETVEALLVSLASPALESVGVTVSDPLADPELRLYTILARDHGDGAHSRYNALVREVVSFRRAAACVK